MIFAKKDIILSSASLIRKEILQEVGIEFSAVDPSIDEEKEKLLIPELDIEKKAMFLAKRKGSIVSRNNLNSIVLSSDQICHIDNETMINKSKNKNEAINQLKKLNNKIHYQSNAVCIFLNGSLIHSCFSIAKLKMNNLSLKEIKDYVTLDNPVGCSGSYKFEKFGRYLFEKVEGDYYTILGFAIQPIISFLYKNKFIYFSSFK